MSNELESYMTLLGERARKASRALAKANTEQKNRALSCIAEAIQKNEASILDANQTDMKNGKDNGLDAALLDRLELTPARVAGMVEGLQQVAALPDPVGEITDMNYRPSGIQLGKMRVPLGVVGIIYESRPNVTIDAASLCLKSGNAAILRGGKEAIASNMAIAKCVAQGLEDAGLSKYAVQVLETTDRAAVKQLIGMPDYVDVIVPRGGKGLIESISKDARVPVIKHLDGVCHVFIDATADAKKAIDIAVNSKTHRYGVCNAMETLLVDETIASKVIPDIFKAYREKGVEIRGCDLTKTLDADVLPATASDWGEEYLAPIVSVKIVKGVDEAIQHINTYGSQHTDAIVTENVGLARQFLTEVDSSSVMVNASTRFADGFEYGLGAEIGISTDKIHVRGPVGLEGLTSQKWIVYGDGHTRS